MIKIKLAKVLLVTTLSYWGIAITFAAQIDVCKFPPLQGYEVNSCTMAEDIADILSDELPLSVSEYETALSVSSNKNVVTTHSKLHVNKKSLTQAANNRGISLNWLIDQIERNMSYYACNSESMREYIDGGVVFRFEYVFEDDTHFNTLVIDNCNSI